MFSFKTILFTLIFIFLGLALFHGNSFAQTAPGTPPGVLITYPACSGVNCDSTQATCTWGAATGAASYSVQITQIDTNTIIATQAVSSSTLTYTFPVTSGQTYKCSVTAINSSGTAGVAGTFSLLCETDVLVNPTAAPGSTVPPIQQIPATGNNFILVSLAAFAGFIMFAGVALLRL